jgi:DNA polymerase-4
VVEVRPGKELAFLHPLPVTALWGVGPATLERLTRFGVTTVRDLAELDEAALVAAVGKAHGQHLHRLSWAIDDRPVEVDREAKSISHEETYPADLHTHDELRRELVRLSDGVAGRLRAHGAGARTFSLKVRFAGFHTITRSVTMPTPLQTAHGIVQAVGPLLAAVDPSPGVRLLGVSASNFGEPAEQLSLDELMGDGESGPVATAGEWQAAEETIDAIRSRFGTSAIGPASAVSRDGLRLVRKGAQQWGPDQGPS